MFILSILAISIISYFQPSLVLFIISSKTTPPNISFKTFHASHITTICNNTSSCNHATCHIFITTNKKQQTPITVNFVSSLNSSLYPLTSNIPKFSPQYVNWDRTECPTFTTTNLIQTLHYCKTMYLIAHSQSDALFTNPYPSRVSYMRLHLSLSFRPNKDFKIDCFGSNCSLKLF